MFQFYSLYNPVFSFSVNNVVKWKLNVNSCKSHTTLFYGKGEAVVYKYFLHDYLKNKIFENSSPFALFCVF